MPLDAPVPWMALILVTLTSSLMIVPVACAAPPMVVGTAAEFAAFCKASVKVSLASLTVSPATVTVTVAEVCPAAMLPLKLTGWPPT